MILQTITINVVQETPESPPQLQVIFAQDMDAITAIELLTGALQSTIAGVRQQQMSPAQKSRVILPH